MTTTKVANAIHLLLGPQHVTGFATFSALLCWLLHERLRVWPLHQAQEANGSIDNLKPLRHFRCYSKRPSTNPDLSGRHAFAPSGSNLGIGICLLGEVGSRNEEGSRMLPITPDRSRRFPAFRTAQVEKAHYALDLLLFAAQPSRAYACWNLNAPVIPDSCRRDAD